MSLRHLSMPRFRRSLLLTSLLLAGTFNVQAADDMLRKAVGKGVYEMALNSQENALWVATSQSRKTDKGGVVYRLDPQTLDITLAVHSDLKPFGATINNQAQTLWFGNTTNGTITAIDAKTGDVKGRVVLDSRQRSKTVKPLQPRELAVDEKTNSVYITGVGKESVVWVVDGATLKLKTTISGTGNRSTALALDNDAQRLYTVSAEGELVTVDTAKNSILTRQKLVDDGKEHAFLNIALDKTNHRAYLTDFRQPEVLVVDYRNGKVLEKIAAPEGLAILFNPTRNEVYVTHRMAGKVSVIDTKTNKVVKTFDTPPRPNSLALSADGKTLFVSVKQESTREKEATQPDDVIRITL
ncbi:YncE family protein [Scandinavium sp. NPDC088450]|uniref:7-bladed beta-propeller protein YncE n=1 Tax=Scandinavium sp. NPDC088450 TaxID=3364514 RepID=UPI00384EAFF0